MVQWFKKRALPPERSSVKSDGVVLACSPPPRPPRPRSGPPLVLPERIGHYRVVGWIGKGGMSEVYRVEFDEVRSNPPQYALKMLASLDDDDAYQR
ncbi:MAG TPA: hypothetical protein VGO93_22680, partial [Candidatus Xenobia bacterium]